MEIETDAEGRFTYSQLGFLDKACVVEVGADGLVPRSFTVDEVCEDRYRVGERRCWGMQIDAALERADSERPRRE